jgi:CRISPR-associated protein Csx16
MATFFISRHPGAIQWAVRKKLCVDRFLPHLDIDEVHAGDTLIGTLPVNLAAQVCAKGAAYWHVSVALPAELRGMELSADDLEQLQARVEQFKIQII